MKNDKFQENVSGPGIIDVKARYRAEVRRLRNTRLQTHTQNMQCLVFRRQHWLLERDSMLRCRYIARLVSHLVT